MPHEAQHELYTQTLQQLVLAAAASEKSSSGYVDQITSPELKKMVAEGAKIAPDQAKTIKELLEKAGGSSGRASNPVIEAIGTVGKDNVSAASDPTAKDLAIIATLQVALHYYVATYGTAAFLAQNLGMSDEAQEIKQINDYMKGKDADYTRLAQSLGL